MIYLQILVIFLLIPLFSSFSKFLFRIQFSQKFISATALVLQKVFLLLLLVSVLISRLETDLISKSLLEKEVKAQNKIGDSPSRMNKVE